VGQYFSLGHAPSETERDFSTTNIHPFNLNGWDFSQTKATDQSAPYNSDIDAQGAKGKIRRKRKK
jgi:hypothetical protein